MANRAGAPWLPLVLLVVGCVPGPTTNTTLVPTNPFPSGKLPSLPDTPATTEETKQEGVRVARVGQKVLSANPQLAVQPRFTLIGVSGTEIFHRGNDEVFVTQGLAQKCKTEGQLAAVLCQELGKMVSEQEAARSFLPANTDLGPPTDVPVGNDYHEGSGASDGTRLMELGKYEQERKRRRGQEAAPPDTLARTYLRKAGFPATDLTEVAPLLRAAQDSAALEKQFNGQLLPLSAK